VDAVVCVCRREWIAVGENEKRKMKTATQTPSKDLILAALRGFVAQRSGMDYRNYGDASSYNADRRKITRDGQTALTLLRDVENSSITAEELAEAFRAFSGRLSLSADNKGNAVLAYCAGQYFPTEYRAAVCAVAAQAMWDYVRGYCMPTPAFSDEGLQRYKDARSEKSVSAGDWLRAYFKRRYGRAIASRWFD
jgi:hypothetical protein